MIFRNPTKKFDQCPHKSIKERRIGDIGQLIVGSVLDCPKAQEDERIVDARASALMATDTGKLSNTVHRDYPHNVIVYRNLEDAHARLGRTASQVICGSCPYASMSPAEVSRTLNEKGITETPGATLYVEVVPEEQAATPPMREITHRRN